MYVYMYVCIFIGCKLRYKMVHTDTILFMQNKNIVYYYRQTSEKDKNG